MLNSFPLRQQRLRRPFGNVAAAGLACVMNTGLACQREPPKQGIFIGAGFLSKDTYAELPEAARGRLEHISVVTSPGPHRNKVAVCTNRHVWLIDPQTRKPTRSTPSPYRCLGAVPIDADGDGTLEVMCRGGGFSDVGLYDNDGNCLWERSGSPSAPPWTWWMSAGDLNRDGEMEFYLATTDGLKILDPSGKEAQHINAGQHYMHVEVLDPGNGHDPMIIASVQKWGSQLVELRSPDGKLLRSFRPADKVHNFRALWWPVGDQRLRLLTYGSTELWEGTRARIVLLDGQGKVAFKHLVPSRMGSPSGAQGTFVRFLSDEPHYLAILLGFRSANRHSVLYLFSLDGTVVYGEVLPRTWGIAVKPSSNGEEILLVGNGRRKVACYRRGKERLGIGTKRP